MFALYIIFQLFSHTTIQNKSRMQNFKALFSANTNCEFIKAAHVKRLVNILTMILIQASIVRVRDIFARNRNLCIDVNMSDVIL